MTLLTQEHMTLGDSLFVLFYFLGLTAITFVLLRMSR